MKLALIADWLTTYGGAEHVLAEMAAVWRDARIFTTVARRRLLGPLEQSAVRVSSLQEIYSVVRNHQLLISRMPRAVEDLDVRGFDVLLSSSHAVAKGIIPSPNSVHVCYCHTPMRYAWEMEEAYLEDFRVPRVLWGSIRQRLKKLRRWDLTTSKRVDRFLCNSRETQERIARIYDREAEVVPPPVADRFFAAPLVPPAQRLSFLAVGRLVPYKRFDLLIEVANVRGLPLTIVGTGQDARRLRALAGPTVELRGFASDDELPSLYAHAKALLFPQREDAGIVPLEAQACGTPVIAYGCGGALDALREDLTGIFFSEQTVPSLAAAIDRFHGRTFDPAMIREHARQFSAEKFRERIQDAVQTAYDRYRR